MTIWEYIALPMHPWFDTSNYLWWQILMFTIGALLWIVVYLYVINHLHKFKEVYIPLWAVTLNIGNEVTGAIFYVPDMGLFLVLAYWVWLLLDLYIVVGLFKYGYKQVQIPYFRDRLKRFLAVWIPLSIVFQYHFVLTYDVPMAPVDAFTINLVMSLCFLYMIFNPTQKVRSKLIGWCKFLGTGIIGVMFYTKYPDHNYLTSMYVACAFIDILYLYLVYNKDLANIIAAQPNAAETAVDG